MGIFYYYRRQKRENMNKKTIRHLWSVYVWDIEYTKEIYIYLLSWVVLARLMEDLWNDAPPPQTLI